MASAAAAHSSSPPAARVLLKITATAPGCTVQRPVRDWD
jgi:hypothetical protein